MAIILAVFVILISYDLSRFIRKKEQTRVFVIYVLLMAASLAVSLLLIAGKKPVSPSKWIEEVLKMVGVIK